MDRRKANASRVSAIWGGSAILLLGAWLSACTLMKVNPAAPKCRFAPAPAAPQVKFYVQDGNVTMTGAQWQAVEDAYNALRAQYIQTAADCAAQGE